MPAGSGTAYVDITMDDGTPTTWITRTSGSDNVYADEFYQSLLLTTSSMHTVVLTNRGHAADASFQLDEILFLTVDGDPILTVPPNVGNGIPTPQPTIDRTTIPSTTPSPSPSSHSKITSSTGLVSSKISSSWSTSSQRSVTSVGQTVTLTQQLTKTGQPGSTSTLVINTPGTQANYRRVHLSAGAIAGIAIGGFFILALFIASCFILKRRRNHSQTHQRLGDNELGTRPHRLNYIPTPYGADPHPASDSTRQLLEKGNVHPISVIRPQLETHLVRTARLSTNLHARDGDTADGHPQSTSLNAGQERSRQEWACEAPPAYQPCDRGTAATVRASIPPAFPGGPSMA